MKTEHKVVIIGCGMVGSTIAYTLMNSELYDQIVLIDSDMSRAEGETLDISHGIPFHRPMQIYAGLYEDVSDAELIIIAAGGNQSASETRLDLTNRNVDIIRQIIPLIMCHNYSGRLLIVSNPVDILTYVAWKLSGLPREHDINDVAISVPRIVGADGIEGYVPLQLNIDEHDALLESKQQKRKENANMLKKILHKLGFQKKLPKKNISLQSSRRNSSSRGISTSHTTVRTVPYTAVQSI